MKFINVVEKSTNKIVRINTNDIASFMPAGSSENSNAQIQIRDNSNFLYVNETCDEIEQLLSKAEKERMK